MMMFDKSCLQFLVLLVCSFCISPFNRIFTYCKSKTKKYQTKTELLALGCEISANSVLKFLKKP